LIDYYAHIGYLTQDPSVFDGTIYENLVYALSDEKRQAFADSNETELKDVITASKCDFIRDFKDGLQTEI
jgi:ABC-type multidrug transport system fused ATPase/permease subunit